MATTKRNIRIPDRRWKAAKNRAADQATNASVVVNASLDLYNSGALDGLLAPLLAAVAAEEASDGGTHNGHAAPAGGAGAGGTG